MDRMVTHGIVGGDGTLVVALGPDLAGRDVQVWVEPAANGASAADEMTAAEWAAFVNSTAGSIADPTFIRHAQGAHQERDSL